MKYLPIGSVVKIQRLSEKPLMIYGRKQRSSLYQKNYDYVAVLYPEGNINDMFNYFFNQDEITEVLHTGYSDTLEEEFQIKVLNKASGTSKENHEEEK